MGIAGGQLSKVEREVGPPYHFPEALEILGDGEVNRPVPWESLTTEQKQFQQDKMTIHAAMIERIDMEIGRILEQLRAMEAYKNTLVVFLSDNGASAEIMVRGDGHDVNAAPGSADSYLCLGPGWSNASNTPFRRHKTWVHEGNRAMHSGDWKIVTAGEGEWELFRLDKDRTESLNLAGDNPEKVLELEKQWQGILDEIREVASR